jgi:hypothetical protein
VRSEELVEVERQDEPLYSWGSLINSNVGKTATLTFSDRGMRPVTGKLLGVGLGEVVYIEVRGVAQTYRLNSIRSIQISGQDAELRSRKSTQPEPMITIRTDGPGTVYVMAVESGMKWTPSYRIDISDPKRLNIVGQATVTNDLAGFENVAVKLVSGFPSLAYLSQFDPFTFVQSPQGGVGGAKFGGDAALAGGGMPAPAAARRQAELALDAFNAPSGEGEQIGDIFFYTLRPVSLAKNERGLYIFANAESDYRQLFTVSVPNFVGPRGDFIMDQASLDTWRSVVFKNSTNEPWTGAPALIMSNGKVLGQNELKYTSPTAEATVEYSKAPGIEGEATESEVSRVSRAIKSEAGSNQWWDLVTIQGKVTLQNRLTETAEMRITKTLTGLAKIASDNGQITFRPSGITNFNSLSTIVWETRVLPGQKKELTYQYELYVVSR